MAPRGVGSTTTTSAVRRVGRSPDHSDRSFAQNMSPISPLLSLPSSSQEREKEKENSPGFLPLFYIIEIFLFYTRSDQESLIPIFFGIVFYGALFTAPFGESTSFRDPNPLPLSLIFLPFPRCPLEVMDCKASEGGSKRAECKKRRRRIPLSDSFSPAAAGFLLATKKSLLLPFFFLAAFFLRGWSD